MKNKATSNKSTNEAVKKINQLYRELVGLYKLSLEKAIEIGELLYQQKEELGHGKWLLWTRKNLPFSERSARNYISLCNNRAALKSARITDLNAAYKILANQKNQYRDQKRVATRKYRKEFADKPSNFRNSRGKYINYINKVIAGDNYDVMCQMLNHGMEGMYSGVITSPGYNSNFYYGKNYDDDKSYDVYLQDLLKRFPLYPKLLRTGGRVIYIIGSVVKNKERKESEDYNHQIISDLKAGVKKVAPELRFYNHIIWDKGEGGKDPLNCQWGTFADPKAPITRCCHENILVWANREFELENIENTEPDITPEEFKEWAWSIWKISPYVRPGNPHPCSFPPKLIERLLKFYTYPNDLILDPYGGVSTLAQICKKHKRRYTSVELNRSYCEYASEILKSA